MNRICENYRFVETMRPWRDLTFKFYADGKLIIIDNTAEAVITPNDLRGDSKDFYIRKRIAFIKNQLLESQLKFA
jgi:hypothetical protein